MKRIASVLTVLALAIVGASATTLFSDNFSYSDGSLITVSGGIWATHSGTAGEVDVQSGKVNLTQSEGEDVSALLSGGPYTSGSLYYSLLIDYSVFPTGPGGYFAHFKDTGTGFRARLYATTNGVPDGSYRLGISNGGNSIGALLSTDLSLGNTYRAVVRYDAGSAFTTLWVDPSLESDLSVTDSTVVTAPGIVGFALRQSRTAGPPATGMGTLTADDVLVGTTFGDVVVIPEPTGLLPLGLLSLAAARLLRRRN